MHKAKNCVISCIDFRFQKFIYDWFNKNNLLGETDLVVIAGASRDLVKPLEVAHRDSLLRQIDLSVKLHDPDNILIIDHQDCGGYAQDKTIVGGLSLEEDKKLHEHFAHEARKLLSKLYPAKAIKTYYVSLDGKIEELNGSN